MARTTVAPYRCTDCGWTTAKWVGRCGECQAWGTVEEVGAVRARTTAVVARRKVVMLGIYAALAGATFWIGTSIPTGFIPQLDRGYAIVVVQLPDGASLSRTDAVVQKATEIIRQTPGVEHAIGITGLNGSTFTSTSNSGVVFATFSSFEERLKAGPSQSLMGIVGQLLGRLQSIPEAFIIAVPPPAPRASAAAPAPGPRRRPGG